jgi:hypothetical protein
MVSPAAIRFPTIVANIGADYAREFRGAKFLAGGIEEEYTATKTSAGLIPGMLFHRT